MPDDVLTPFCSILDFNPKAVIFSPKQRMQIVVSDIGIFIWAAVLCYSIGRFGFLDVFKTYLAPYFWSVPPLSLSFVANPCSRR